MTQPLMPRQKHTDLHPRLGPGLFVDERVPGSVDRAVTAIAEYIAILPEDEKKLTRPFDEAVARKILHEPIRLYWADNDYDARVKFSDLKVQARQLHTRAQSFNKSIKDLSVPMKSALRMYLTRHYGEASPGEDRLTVAHEMNVAIIRACDALIEPQYDKTPERGVISLAEPLWEYWESMRAKPFRRSWTDCNTRLALADKLGPISFSHIDALFVQVVIKAIDSEADFSDIRTRLKSVAKSRPSRRKQRSAVAR